MAVIRAFATDRECGDIPEAANTITANSCSESNFGRTRPRTLEMRIEKVGILSEAMVIPQLALTYAEPATVPCFSGDHRGPKSLCFQRRSGRWMVPERLSADADRRTHYSLDVDRVNRRCPAKHDKRARVRS